MCTGQRELVNNLCMMHQSFVVRPHLYSCGLSSIKPIWKVTARVALFQTAINSFAEFTAILEGRGFITEGLEAGGLALEGFSQVSVYCLVCHGELSYGFKTQCLYLFPRGFLNQTLVQGERSLFHLMCN